jgi:hypothetical protein
MSNVINDECDTTLYSKSCNGNGNDNDYDNDNNTNNNSILNVDDECDTTLYSKSCNGNDNNYDNDNDNDNNTNNKSSFKRKVSPNNRIGIVDDDNDSDNNSTHNNCSLNDDNDNHTNTNFSLKRKVSEDDNKHEMKIDETVTASLKNIYVLEEKDIACHEVMVDTNKVKIFVSSMTQAVMNTNINTDSKQHVNKGITNFNTYLCNLLCPVRDQPMQINFDNFTGMFRYINLIYIYTKFANIYYTEMCVQILFQRLCEIMDKNPEILKEDGQRQLICKWDEIGEPMLYMKGDNGAETYVCYG